MELSLKIRANIDVTAICKAARPASNDCGCSTGTIFDIAGGTRTY